MRAVYLVGVCALACHGRPAEAPLAPAGKIGGENEPSDDGAGDVALASANSGALMRVALGGGDGSDSFADEPTAAARAGAAGDAIYGGDEYGGSDGGDPYGGVNYATWAVPRFDYVAPIRVPRYTPVNGLVGAVEGTITWTGAAPGRVTTACGTIDNPTLRLGPKNAVRGALVFIESVSTGRALPAVGKVAGTHGVVAKQGCAFVPAAQVMSAPGGRISIHGDATRTRVRVTGSGAPSMFELQEGGLVETGLKNGVTRVENDDGSAAPAWLVPVDSPYFTLTDDSGHYRLGELGAGTYEITVWQPPPVAIKDGVITYGAPVVSKQKIHVDGVHAARLDFALR